MPSFLFTAINRDGKSITERVEAENLSQAGYKIEIRGYSEILFCESELSKDVDQLFDEKKLKDAEKKYLENQVNCFRKLSLILLPLKKTSCSKDVKTL